MIKYRRKILSLLIVFIVGGVAISGADELARPRPRADDHTGPGGIDFLPPPPPPAFVPNEEAMKRCLQRYKLAIEAELTGDPIVDGWILEQWREVCTQELRPI